METLNLIQGTQEWLDARKWPDTGDGYFLASEAPAMMGASPYVTRAQLLREKATGAEPPDVSPALEKIFSAGHMAEANARVIAEERLGCRLEQTVATEVIDGMKLLASLDGFSMALGIVWEHKLWNEAKAKQMAELGDLLEEYYWQVEHLLLVTAAGVCYFCMSRGTAEPLFVMQYRSVPGRRERLIAGWKQFHDDLRSCQDHWSMHPQSTLPPAEPVRDFPVLWAEVSGSVTASNIAEFKGFAEALVSGINTELATDQDFANAEDTVKKLKKAEQALELARQQVLEKTASIAELFRDVDYVKELFRSKRLQLERLTKSEKENKRAAILQCALDDLHRHHAAASDAVGFLLPPADSDFRGAMKGMKTINSLEDEAAAHLANCKVSVTLLRDMVLNNKRILAGMAEGRMELFPDADTLVLKESGDMVAVIGSRLAGAAVKPQSADCSASAALVPAQRVPDARPSSELTSPATQPAPALDFDASAMVTRLEIIIRDIRYFSANDLRAKLLGLANELSMGLIK